MPWLEQIDIDRIMSRYEAWWLNDLTDRPVLRVGIEPRGSALVPPKQHISHRDRWLDIDYALERFADHCARTPPVADNLPCYNPNLGPDLVATLYGSPLEFGERTTWSSAVVQDCGQILALQPGFAGEYWQAIRRFTQLSLQAGAGRWLTGITDLHTNGDLLAALRGPEGLCIDVADDPQAVAAACNHVTNYFPAIYNDLYDRIAAQQGLCSSWIGTVHAGRCYPVSCDIICLLGPTAFHQCILGPLQREMSALNRSIFHLDGPAALVHLDALLEQPALHAIQWQFGAAGGPATRWVEVYRRIQAAGKAILIECGDFDHARLLARHLKPQGIMLNVGRAYSAAEIADFERFLEAWAAGKPSAVA